MNKLVIFQMKIIRERQSFTFVGGKQNGDKRSRVKNLREWKGKI